MQTFTYLDYIALFSTLLFWQFYDMYARHRTFKKGDSLIKAADVLRKHWVYKLIENDLHNRIQDAQLVNLLHRGISFFITITIFIIAGLMAMLTSGDAILAVLAKLPFQADNVAQTWSLKIILIIIIFIVAFFRLTWALRQNQFYAIAILGAPNGQKHNHQLILKIVSLISDSGKNFNSALRSYYFGLSLTSWLIHPILCVFSAILVVWVVYRREFHSKTLSMLNEICQEFHKSDPYRKFID